jgi:hypothetical protein
LYGGIDVKSSSTILVLLCAGTLAAAEPTLHINPTDSFGGLGERLAREPGIREVIFGEGVYHGHLHVSGPGDADFSERALVLRAADGARVVFDGSQRLHDFEPHPDLRGVFRMPYTHRGGEYPKLCEPDTRRRYRLVADAASVVRFPASYTVEENRLLFPASNGQSPEAGQLLISSHDCGMFINRPHVTVRGIEFQDYLAREKWSTAVDLRVDHITVEDCTARNCSLGFIVTGNHPRPRFFPGTEQPQPRRGRPREDDRGDDDPIMERQLS